MKLKILCGSVATVIFLLSIYIGNCEKEYAKAAYFGIIACFNLINAYNIEE